MRPPGVPVNENSTALQAFRAARPRMNGGAKGRRRPYTRRTAPHGGRTAGPGYPPGVGRVAAGVCLHKLVMLCYGVLKNRAPFDPAWSSRITP